MAQYWEQFDKSGYDIYWHWKYSLYMEANKKNNNFEIDNIYDYLKIIDILQNEKEKDRNAVFKEFYYIEVFQIVNGNYCLV